MTNSETRIHCVSTANTLTVSWVWIKVSDELPKGSQEVLITDGVRISLGHLTRTSMLDCGQYWYDEDGRTDGVTHWMQLPQLPKDTE